MLVPIYELRVFKTARPWRIMEACSLKADSRQFCGLLALFNFCLSRMPCRCGNFAVADGHEGLFGQVAASLRFLAALRSRLLHFPYALPLSNAALQQTGKLQ